MQPDAGCFTNGYSVRGWEMLRRKPGLVFIWAGLTCAFSVGDAVVTHAKSGPAPGSLAIRIAVNGNWGTYAYEEDGISVCYILTYATGMAAPAEFDHGRVYFLVSRISKSSPGYQPEFRTSYDMQQGAAVAVTNMSFDLLVRGNDAWIANIGDESVVIAAMKAAQWMQVSARTAGGMPTSYVFSLQGFNAALDSIDTCANKFLSERGRADRPAAA
jgi:hypothetical protein